MYDRAMSIGASDAVHIQAGKWAECYDWKQGTDSDDWPLAAEIGKRLEGFNLELFAQETGSQVHIDPKWRDNPIIHSLDDWCTYTPDGLTYADELADDMTAEPRIPVECKAINMMWKPANLLAKYMPQLQHAMRVMGAPYCWFSVIYLNTRHKVTKVMYDPPYDLALFEKEKLFYWFLEQQQRPPQKKGRVWI